MTRASGVVALACAAAFGALAAQQRVHDPDLFWHLATAQRTLAEGLVRVDVFSWSATGTLTTVDQWLGELIIYAAYLAGDWRGIIVVRALAVAVLVGLVVANALLARPERPLLAVIAGLPAVFLTRFVWVDRPELLGFAAFAALLVLLRLGRGGRSWALVACVPLVALWANLHGSYAVGVVVALAACVEGAWVDAPRRRMYALVAFGVVFGSMLTPAGPGAFFTPGSHFFSPTRDIMEEGVIDVRTQLGALYAVTLVLVLACALAGSAVWPRETVVLVPVVFLSLTALRHAPFLAIAAAPLLVTRIDEVARLLWSGITGRATTRDARPRTAASRDLPRPAFVGLAGGALAVLAVAMAAAPPDTDESSYPKEALAALPRGAGLFNTYDWGGWLIWRAPQTPVFIDGRLTPYLGRTLDDYRIVVAGAPSWREVVDRRRISALLVRPSDPIAVRAAELGWRQLARSEQFVLLVPR